MYRIKVDRQVVTELITANIVHFNSVTSNLDHWTAADQNCTRCSRINYYHLPTKSVNVVKIGPGPSGHSEIFGMICRCLPYIDAKFVIFNIVNFGVILDQISPNFYAMQRNLYDVYSPQR